MIDLVNCLCKNEPEMNPIVVGTKLMWECPSCGRAITRPDPMKITFPVKKDQPIHPRGPTMMEVDGKVYRLSLVVNAVAIRTATHTYTIDFDDIIRGIANIEDILLRTIEVPNPKGRDE
jgi:hypothetical protein